MTNWQPLTRASGRCIVKTAARVRPAIPGWTPRTGDWVLFLDADDALFTRSVGRAGRPDHRRRHDFCSALRGKAAVRSSPPTTCPRGSARTYRLSAVRSPLLFDTGLLAAPLPLLFGRAAIGAVRFDARLAINEDVLFNIQFYRIPLPFIVWMVYTRQYDTEAGSLSRRLRGTLLDAERVTRPALSDLLRQNGIDPAPYEAASRLRACLNQYGLLTGCKGTPYAERRALFAEILADPPPAKPCVERLRNDPNRLLAVPYRIGVACNWPGLLAGYTMAKQRLL